MVDNPNEQLGFAFDSFKGSLYGQAVIIRVRDHHPA